MPRKRKPKSKNNGKKALADCVLPDDVTMCILTRLPVKSLLRFKAVCKPWRNLFATPKFIRAHHSHFSGDWKNQGSISSASQYYIVQTMSLFKKPTDLDPIHLRMEFVGCWSGLICLGLPPLGQVILVWNPAMKLFKFLPLSKADFGVPFMFSLGFGYDQERDDFKVVRIFYVKELGGKTRVGVEVYSSLSDSWETIKLEFEFHVFLTINSTIINGKPFWIAKMDGSGNIGMVWFDVREMVFRKISLDSFEVDENVLKDFVTLSRLGIEALMDQEGSAWVFREGHFIPVELKLKNGKILEFWFDGKRFVFDPERRCVMEMGIMGVDGYSESLSCIKGMKPLG